MQRISHRIQSCFQALPSLLPLAFSISSDLSEYHRATLSFDPETTLRALYVRYCAENTLLNRCFCEEMLFTCMKTMANGALLT